MLNSGNLVGKRGLGFVAGKERYVNEYEKSFFEKFVKSQGTETGVSKPESNLPVTSLPDARPASSKPVTNKLDVGNTKIVKIPEDIGSLTSEQLEEHLRRIPNKKKTNSMLGNKDIKKSVNNMSIKEEKKETRNGKVGVGRASNFLNLASAPRKTCNLCGSTNHLRINCKLNLQKIPEVIITPQPPLIKCQYCGSIKHPSYACDLFRTPYVQIPYSYANWYDSMENETEYDQTSTPQPKTAKTPKVKVDLTDKGKKQVSKPAWVLKKD